MTARLSIVMPVFNHPEELKTMLDSILANTYQDWELLAVDDGSEQETLALLDQYAAADSRIKAIRRDRQPKGAQTCRNIGMELAKGEFIIFFDSDDYVLPYCLDQRVSEMEANPNLDFMVFRSGRFREHGFESKADKHIYGYPIYKDDVAAFCARTLPFVVWNNIYLRQALLHHGIRWDTSLLSLQDAQFNLECLASGMQYSYSSNIRPDYGYRTIRGVGTVSKKIRTAAHQNSHLTALKNFYDITTKHYGSKYNRHLFLGALYILNLLTEDGYNVAAANGVCHIVKEYSPCYGSVLKTLARMMALLSGLLPPKRVRQVVLFPYLLLRIIQTKQKVRHIDRKMVNC